MDIFDFKKHVGISTSLLKHSAKLYAEVETLSVNFTIVEIVLEHELRWLIQRDKSTWAQIMHQLQRLRRQKNLILPVHAPYLEPNTDIAVSPIGTRHEAVWLMMEAMEQAAELQSPYLVCHPGGLQYPISRPKILDNLRYSVEKLVMYADKLNVALCLKNTGHPRARLSVMQEEALLSLCQEFPIGIALDLTQFCMFRYHDPKFYSTLDRFLPYIKSVYITGISTPLAETHLLKPEQLPFHNILASLFAQNYQGTVIIR